MDISAILNDTILKYVLTLLAAITCALLARVFNDARVYLASKTSAQVSDTIFEEIRRLVLAAEQYLTTADGQAKMKWVLDTVVGVLKSHNIVDVPEETLRLYAEAAVKQEINNYPDLKSFTAQEVKLNTPATTPVP